MAEKLCFCKNGSSFRPKLRQSLVKYKRTVTPNNIFIALLNLRFDYILVIIIPDKAMKMLFEVTVLLYFIKILGGSRN